MATYQEEICLVTHQRGNARLGFQTEAENVKRGLCEARKFAVSMEARHREAQNLLISNMAAILSI